MWDNIGEKIKELAKIIFFVGVAILSLACIIVTVIKPEFMKFAVAILAGGAAVLLLTAYVFYGFGEIVIRICDVSNDYFERKEREEKGEREKMQPIVTEEDEAVLRLEALLRLKECGAITEEEYNNKKEEILDRI